MPQYSEDMVAINTRQPKALKDKILGALNPGETQADFLREAIVLLLKKRGVKTKKPAVRMGRPPGSSSD